MVRSKLYQSFAETSLENVDLTETKDCLDFVSIWNEEIQAKS